MTSSFLTAYYQDIQKFIRTSEKVLITKNAIYAEIEHKAHSMGESIHTMFPRKQGDVLDKIIAHTKSTGIWTIGREKLAERTGCSVRTVANAVRSIKDTEMFIVARQANDHAGKYIFVLKSHPNFKRILRDVFFLSEKEWHDMKKD